MGTAIGRSTISSILKEKEKWLLFPMQRSTDSTRDRSCKEPLLESALSMWFNDVRTKNLPVNSDMIIEKAKKFGGELRVVGFSYSNGWLKRFKKRHGILLHKVHGESNKVNLADVEKSREELRCIISEYELSDVYNMDEAGLFYRLEQWFSTFFTHGPLFPSFFLVDPFIAIGDKNNFLFFTNISFKILIIKAIVYD